MLVLDTENYSDYERFLANCDDYYTTVPAKQGFNYYVLLTKKARKCSEQLKCFCLSFLLLFTAAN